MKPDFETKTERNPKAPSSQQRAAEEPREDASRAKSDEEPVAYKQESGVAKDAIMQDAEDDAELCKLPRLPSIKHLHLDMGLQSPWHMVDQFTLSQKSPMLHSGSSSPLSISPIGTPIDFSLFATSPPLMSAPTSPTMVSPPHTPTMNAHPLPSNAFISLAATNFANVKSLFAPVPVSGSSSSFPSSAPANAFPSRNASVSLLAQDTPIVPAASAVSNNFGFIETTFAAPSSKKTHRRRPANVDKGTLYCHNCGSKNTPEWRRGPGGPATLCNACGLAFAKRQRQDDEMPQTTTQLIPIPLNPVVAAASGIPLNGFNSCTCAHATTYGSCVHMQHQPQAQRPLPSQPQPPPPQQQQQASRPMQMMKGMPVRINSHTFHNYTPPTPHPSVQQRNQGPPVANQITFY